MAAIFVVIWLDYGGDIKLLQEISRLYRFKFLNIMTVISITEVSNVIGYTSHLDLLEKVITVCVFGVIVYTCFSSLNKSSSNLHLSNIGVTVSHLNLYWPMPQEWKDVLQQFEPVEKYPNLS